jgi:hypothetical protein
MSEPPVASSPAAPRRHPPREKLPLSEYGGPEATAARGDFSLPTLWRAVDQGHITPPSYPTPKTPRFHFPTFDADMVRLRAKPSANEAGRRAAKLAEARKRARDARESQPKPEGRATA